MTTITTNKEYRIVYAIKPDHLATNAPNEELAYLAKQGYLLHSVHKSFLVLERVIDLNKPDVPVQS